jgi:hypothetical protein
MRKASFEARRRVIIAGLRLAVLLSDSSAERAITDPSRHVDESALKAGWTRPIDISCTLTQNQLSAQING